MTEGLTLTMIIRYLGCKANHSLTMIIRYLDCKANHSHGHHPICPHTTRQDNWHGRNMKATESQMKRNWSVCVTACSGEQHRKYQSPALLDLCEWGESTSAFHKNGPQHYSDVIKGVLASQITILTIVYSTVYWDTDQRKHQSSALLAFVRGIHRGPVNSPHKWPVTRKMFPFDDVIMNEESVCMSWRHHASMPHYSHTITRKCWQIGD